MDYISSIILFYSGFSENCKKTLHLINEYHVPIEQICVDSKYVRDKLNSTKKFYKIKGVPSLVVSYEDGNSELYEGEKVNIWIANYINFLTTPRQNMNQQVHTKTTSGLNQQQEFHQSFASQQQYDDNDNDYDLIEEDLEELPPDPNVKPSKKNEKMSSLKLLAKEMEMQRKKALGNTQE